MGCVSCQYVLLGIISTEIHFCELWQAGQNDQYMTVNMHPEKEEKLR